MLDFIGKEQKAQLMCLHYAKELNAHNLVAILDCRAPVKSKEEAEALAKFFWNMLDASAADKDNSVEVLGERDLQYWMERNMNIFLGYLYQIGFGDEWEKICDQA